jgi:hypothetical protein
MLSYLFGLIQAFERAHGRLPLLVCLNTRHLQQLLNECPCLASGNHPMPLGFRISVLPEDALPHPKVMLLPAVVPMDCAPRYQPTTSMGAHRWPASSSNQATTKAVRPSRPAAPAHSATPRRDSVHPALRTPA